MHVDYVVVLGVSYNQTVLYVIHVHYVVAVEFSHDWIMFQVFHAVCVLVAGLQSTRTTMIELLLRLSRRCG